ncbi:hypothetical protein Q7C36_018750 [Tachysurus vachellii]|uniref:Uncharacterized protein n=1 Tax=Tachysurus vachellii TaxID=175792 RepID=A0AA88S9Y2_TACVA|nr:hypothetical protein Q7C36_018750 [Tachysurus vachellii]
MTTLTVSMVACHWWSRLSVRKIERKISPQTFTHTACRVLTELEAFEKCVFSGTGDTELYFFGAFFWFGVQGSRDNKQVRHAPLQSSALATVSWERL